MTMSGASAMKVGLFKQLCIVSLIVLAVLVTSPYTFAVEFNEANVIRYAQEKYKAKVIKLSKQGDAFLVRLITEQGRVRQVRVNAEDIEKK